MPNLRNNAIDMEIGYVNVGTKKQIYIQIGKERQYYGTLIPNKAEKFLKMLQKWDEAGGNDNDDSSK